MATQPSGQGWNGGGSVSARVLHTHPCHPIIITRRSYRRPPYPPGLRGGQVKIKIKKKGLHQATPSIERRAVDRTTPARRPNYISHEHRGRGEGKDIALLTSTQLQKGKQDSTRPATLRFPSSRWPPSSEPGGRAYSYEYARSGRFKMDPRPRSRLPTWAAVSPWISLMENLFLSTPSRRPRLQTREQPRPKQTITGPRGPDSQKKGRLCGVVGWRPSSAGL